MQESRESLVSVQTTSTLAQSSICTGDKLLSVDKECASKTTLSVDETDDASQDQDVGVVPSKSTEKALSDTTSEQETKTCDLSEIEISTGCKGVRRCATFPRNEGDATVPKSVARGKEPVMESLTYERSKSFPTYLKSAMKGSRAHQPGASPRSADLHVRWAPDVCDPPVTSQSHTVQSNTGQKGGGGGSSSKGKRRSKKKDKRRNKG